MTDSSGGVLRTLQEFVIPDLKTIQAKHEALCRQMELQHNALMATMAAFRAEMRSEFAALRATNQLKVYRQVSPLNERTSVVERRG